MNASQMICAMFFRKYNFFDFGKFMLYGAQATRQGIRMEVLILQPLQVGRG